MSFFPAWRDKVGHANTGYQHHHHRSPAFTEADVALARAAAALVRDEDLVARYEDLARRLDAARLK